MNADLDALLRKPDDFERRLFAIEKVLHLVEDCRLIERQLIRDLANALADADEDAVKYRGIKPPDLGATIEDSFEFLHKMHELYTAQCEGARAARELLDRRGAAA